MKIALLHGAAINAGDFLIAKRSKELLEYVFPDAIITEYYRNESIEPELYEINNHDIMILAGGPGYVNEFYPMCAPLVSDLSMIKIPIMFLGMGWWGVTSLPHYLYGYHFSGPMLDLLRRASNDTKYLTCRDYLTTTVLRNNGFDNVVMTGCPAWYYLPNVNEVRYQKKTLPNARKICISDCVNPCYYPLMMDLIKHIQKLFAQPDITVVFHRSMNNVTPELQLFLTSNNIEYIDIAHSADGFKIYDDCDLHIGFRVHAHIYNLSIRNLSILIGEDSRGIGVNTTLGLPNITACTHNIRDNAIVNIENPFVIYQVEDYILDLISNNNLPINRAFETMQKGFQTMVSQIESIKQII